MIVEAGILTSTGRAMLLGHTINSIELDAGFLMPDFFRDNKRSGCWQAWLSLLRRMVDGHGSATHLLLAEDDVSFARGLGRYLEHNPPPAGSIANLFCTPECHSPELMQWHPQPLPQRAQGSLALLLPLAIARELAAAPPFPDRRDGTDHNIGTFCRDRGIPFVTHSPSLVLHATTETSLTEARGRDENRQAFCFAESIENVANITADDCPNPSRSPATAAFIDAIGDFPAEYSGELRRSDHPSRRRLPQHPHTVTIYYREAGA